MFWRPVSGMDFPTGWRMHWNVCSLALNRQAAPSYSGAAGGLAQGCRILINCVLINSARLCSFLVYFLSVFFCICAPQLIGESRGLPGLAGTTRVRRLTGAECAATGSSPRR